MMEKGKISITKTNKGELRGAISYKKKSGKDGSINIPIEYILNENYNNKECEFERDGGKIINIMTDGKNMAKKSKPAINKNNSSYKNNRNNSNKNNNFSKDVTNLSFLPKDTKNAIKIPSIDNFNLKFNKIINQINGKLSFFKMERNAETIKIKAEFSDSFIKNINNIYYGSIKKLGLNIKESTLKTEWKMVVGLGGNSVYETSITLHHIYGIPYIPAQALKGVIRSHIIQTIFNSEEDLALKDKIFCDIFGTPEGGYYGKESRRGKIIFFDVFPTTVPKIDVDIMNPHYQKYYSEGNNAPTDYYSPIPINFLVVKDTDFKFTIGVDGINNYKNESSKFIGNNILDIAYFYMNEALQEEGIGSKTAVGYGYFS